MYHLYYASACENIGQLPDGVLKVVVVSWKNRGYLNRLDYLRYLMTFGRYKKIIVLNSNGTVMHISCTMGKCFKFPFLIKNSVEIGPCVTYPNFRGRGIYPAVLRYIRGSGWYQHYYMLVREDNISSIRGVEKAGFVKIGEVQKRFGRWCRV